MVKPLPRDLLLQKAMKFPKRIEKWNDVKFFFSIHPGLYFVKRSPGRFSLHSIISGKPILISRDWLKGEDG